MTAAWSRLFEWTIFTPSAAADAGRQSDGFDFVGFRIHWRRKKGITNWYVYTFISTRAPRSVKATIRAITDRTSQQDLAVVLINLNQITHGWAHYF